MAVYQPASSDTYITSANPTTNYGTSTVFDIGENGAAVSVERTLIKWDALSDGTIPSGATILSASLAIYATTDYSTNVRTMRVYRQKRAWVETQATWNIYSTGNNWGAQGGFDATDCEQTDIGSLELSASESLNEFKTITLTPSAIQEIVNGTWANNGFLIKMDTETNDMYRYASSDNGTAENRPKLTVTWTIRGGVQIIII